MGLASSRLTDVGVGICCCHSQPPCQGTVGMLVTAAANINDENLPSARMTDIVLHGCGHVGIVVTGAANINDENQPSARLSDAYVGCVTGVLVTGAATVFKG